VKRPVNSSNGLDPVAVGQRGLPSRGVAGQRVCSEPGRHGNSQLELGCRSGTCLQVRWMEKVEEKEISCILLFKFEIQRFGTWEER